jgi:hypothetical protein
VHLYVCIIHIRITPLRIEHQGYYPYTVVFASTDEHPPQWLLQGLQDLIMCLHCKRSYYRPNFIPIKANFLYYHQLLTGTLASGANGDDHHWENTSQVAINGELSNLYQGSKDDGQYNRLLCIFSLDYQYLNYPHPRLFIVLLSNFHFLTNPNPVAQSSACIFCATMAHPLRRILEILSNGANFHTSQTILDTRSSSQTIFSSDMALIC